MMDKSTAAEWVTVQRWSAVIEVKRGAGQEA